MSYRISVPIMNKTIELYGSEIYIEQLKNMKAERVFICPSGGFNVLAQYKEELESLRKNISIFKSAGFEVGVWVWTFQYPNGDFTYMKSPDGKISSTSVCPTDKKYRKLMGDFVSEIACCGVDIIMFDDDYRYSFIDIGFGCCCDNHLKMISDELGEDVDLSTIRNRTLYGSGDKYRSAFIKANGKALVDFAKEMRRRLNDVNPNIRMGFCSCINSWDLDGAHPDDIAKALAGNTRPFYRLIGAPYWTNNRSWGNRLGDVIELERLEASRRKDDNIEIFSECDMYPRPRFITPAAYTEGFDTALRASGCMDGILKYVLDYSSHPLTETGYYRKHIENQKLYQAIDNLFSDKENIGIRVFDKALKFDEITIPDKFCGTCEVQNEAFNVGARLLTDCSLPVVYNGTEYSGVAFGEDVKQVTERDLSNGLIIDISAAEILEKKGIDVGLESVGKTYDTNLEVFEEDNNHISLGFGASFREVKVKPASVIESRFVCENESFPGSYRYENADGIRFLVFCFDAYFNGEGLFRNYPRAKQIINAVPWLCGKKLPAVITGNPDLYVQLKENAESVVVGLWNFSPDDITNPIVDLSFTPTNISTLNCSAKIDGLKLKLSRIEPYGFAAIELK